jgi:hypothetical protein
MPFIGAKPATVPLTSADLEDNIITSAKIVDGAIVNADINASAAIAQSKLSGSFGITNAQQWRVTANFNGTTNPISSNWEEVDNKYSRIGSAMSVSSGIWTFPETGIWLITYQARNLFTGTYAYYEALINGSNDNFSSQNYLSLNTTAGTNSSSTQYRGVTATAMFDVTDTSNDKVSFGISADGSVTTQGDTTTTMTGVTFIRLGDT